MSESIIRELIKRKLKLKKASISKLIYRIKVDAKEKKGARKNKNNINGKKRLS